MKNNETLIFFNRMLYQAGTRTLNGLAALAINTIYFRFSPALDDDAAYLFFKYMSQLCEKICGQASVNIAMNAAAYLIDKQIPFSVRFRWERSLSVWTNLKHLFHIRNFRRTLAAMKNDMAADPSLRWSPYCEQILLDINGRLEPETDQQA